MESSRLPWSCHMGITSPPANSSRRSCHRSQHCYIRPQHTARAHTHPWTFLPLLRFQWVWYPLAGTTMDDNSAPEFTIDLRIVQVGCYYTLNLIDQSLPSPAPFLFSKSPSLYIPTPTPALGRIGPEHNYKDTHRHTHTHWMLQNYRQQPWITTLLQSLPLCPSTNGPETRHYLELEG